MRVFSVCFFNVSSWVSATVSSTVNQSIFYKAEQTGKLVCFWSIKRDSPSLVWCPSIQSADCGGSKTEPPLDYLELGGCLWKASSLSEAGGVQALAFSQTAAHIAPYHRRTCPPLSSDDKRKDKEHQGEVSEKECTHTWDVALECVAGGRLGM